MRWLAVPMAVALLLTQLAATAFGEHGGREIGSVLNCDRPVIPPRCTSVGDDLRHHVAFDASLTDALASALRASMAEDYGPTRLSLIEDETITSFTDVIAYSGDYGDNGAAAWVYCPSASLQGVNRAGDRWCRHQELHLNLNPRFGLFFDDAASRSHVACHELGHTLGLRHWGNPPQSDGPAAATCMNSNTPNGPTTLHEFDVEHIDAYPYQVRRSPAFRLVRAPDDGAIASAPAAGGMVGASEVEVPTSLAALVDGADVVVHGRVVAVERGRAFGPPAHPLHYAEVTVSVARVLAGRTAVPGATSLTMEIPLFDGPGQLAQIRNAMLDTERLMFLRNKGESAATAGLPVEAQRDDRAFYRLLTFGSEVVNAGSLAAVPPHESGVLDEFGGMPFDEVAASVEALASD